MLTFPEVLTYQGHVVYPDDEDPNLFYAVGGRPRIRTEDGKPVFRALFWTDAADGGNDAVAGLRGAQLHFDVDLSIPPSALAEMKKQIEESGVQARRAEIQVAEAKERAQRLARAKGQNPSGVKVEPPVIGPVRWGSVAYSGGKVALLEETSGGFVAWSSAGGPPSLLGDNNASFVLRLSAEGAAVWYRALENGAASLGVRFELAFEARLPSLQIHVWAGSHQSLDLEREVTRTVQNLDRGCDNADTVYMDETAITERLVEDGLVNVEIVKGTAQITDEHVAQLRNAALGLITDRVKEVLLHRIRGMTPEERKSSLARKVVEEVNAFAELRLTQRDVITWKVNPQATITDFLSNLSAEARKSQTVLVDLADPVVSTVEVPVSVSAEWGGAIPITRVLVDLEYPPAGELARKSFELTKDKPTAIARWRRARGDHGTVRYSARAFVLGAADPIVLPPKITNGAAPVEVPALGSISFKARAHASTFNGRGGGAITSVEVRYAYKEPGDIDHFGGSLPLRKEDVDGGAITALVRRPLDGPVRLRPIYSRGDFSSITGAEQLVWVRAGAAPGVVEVPLPYRDTLRVGAAVRAGLRGLQSAEVRVDYHDEAHDFDADDVILLDKDSSWTGKATLALIDKSRQRFRYQVRLVGADQIAVGPWLDAEGDQDLVLPVMTVRIRTHRLEIGTKYEAAMVRLVYDDPARSYTLETELELTRDDAVWLVPRADPHVDGFRYSLTLFPTTGGRVDVPEQQDRGELLILSPPA